MIQFFIWQKRSYFLFALLISVCLYSQSKVDHNWDLLFNNQRDQARSYFDEHFAKQKNSDIELLILDAMIDEQLGQFNFNDSFIRELNKLKAEEGYLYPLLFHKFMMNDISVDGIDDFTFEKVDLMAENPNFGHSITLLNLKHYGEVYRKKYADAKKTIAKIYNINKWQRAGPFENLNGSGLDTFYEPEVNGNIDKLFNANSLGKVGWYNPKFLNIDYFQYLMNESEYGESIFYTQSFVENPVERRVNLQVNINSDYKVFVNDQEIFVSNRNGFSSPYSQLIELNLPKGVNRILFKISLSNNVVAFMGQFTDLKDQPLKDLKYYDTYKPYKKSSLEEISPQEKQLPFEELLTQKIAENPTKTIYKYLLAETYVRNSQLEQARVLLDELLLKYPSSSMIRGVEMSYYTEMNDGAKKDEIVKKMQIDDEGYFYSILSKMDETSFFDTTPTSGFLEVRDNLTKTKATPFVYFFDLLIAAKNRDLDQMEVNTVKLRDSFHNNDQMFGLIVTMENVNNVDQSKMIKSYEDFLSTRLNQKHLGTLQNLYRNSNQIDLYKQITDEYINVFPNFNSFRNNKLDVMFSDFKNPEIEKEIDNTIGNFPYSYSALALKADYLAKTNRKNEAVDYAKRSLSHYSANQNLRDLIRDLENKESDIQRVGLQEVEDYIAKNRNAELKGSSGVTVLYDEYIAEVVPEGGFRSRATALYEITSDKGVNEMKEFYLDGAETILKSEVHKKDGKVVPGERSYDEVVFTNLEVGDVIVIQSEGTSSSTGRFYKDFYFYSYFGLGYPSLKSVLTVITPAEINYQFKANNGETPFTEKIENGKKYRTWTAVNTPEIIKTESYSKNYNDRAKSITVSSISSWKEIANWYADLIKKNLVFDQTTEGAYLEIFPNGTSGLSDYDKAFKIYDYIEKNINYSSVDFRQSGYIPQKPSKTLVSKLGDCKDLSTLFVMFAEKAGLEANLVLVRTSDLDVNSLILPNINFNHCIVQVKLNGKTTYLEMTDKNFPFNSVSKGNYHAKGLVVYMDKNKNERSQLFDIPDTNNEKILYKTRTQAQLTGDVVNFSTTQSVQGGTKSFFSDFFSDEKTDEEKKNYFEEDYGSRLNELLNVKSVNLISGKDVTNQPLVLQVDYEASENPQSLGELMILKIPFLTKPFTKDIISLEKRTSDIKYSYYENQHQYDEEIKLLLPENSVFVEIPKNKKFKYKDFDYSLSYQLIKPNQLIVTRKSSTPWKEISKEEYGKFRSFVESILHAENQVLGYKKVK